MKATQRVHGLGTYAVATAALASGAALLVHLLTRWSLVVALVTTVAVAVWSLYLATRRMPEVHRARLATRARRGSAVAIVATIVYDAVRWLLVGVLRLDANPWEALPEFGRLLVGVDAGVGAVWAAGLAYHVANGVGFGVAYAVLVRRPRVRSGIVWALGLEALMLALYPGWLDIRSVQEFASVSMVGHLAYGATLGWLGGRAAAGVPDAVPAGVPGPGGAVRP